MSSALVVNAASACYPGIAHEEAIARLIEHPPEEAHIGVLAHRHVQLCPQNRGPLDPDRAYALRQRFPGVAMRLHANVRLGASQPSLTVNDVGPETWWYFDGIGASSRALGAACYTLHCGPRQGEPLSRCALQRIADQRERLEQRLDLPAAVEGMCAARDWLSSWGEYRALLEGHMRYAIDLSHLAIVAHRERVRDDGLVRELLLSDRCLEVHLSANDGIRDRHEPLGVTPPWWWPILTHAWAQGMTATLFSEGNQLRRQRHPARFTD